MWMKVLTEWHFWGEILVKFFEWMPCCLLVKGKEGTMILTIGNRTLNNNIVFKNLSKLPTAVVIHSIWTNAAVMAEVNIYSDLNKNILNMPRFPGDVLAWNASLWQYSRALEPNVKVSQVSWGMVLGQASLGIFLVVPVKMDFYSAQDMCKKLGNGTLAKFRSRQEMEQAWLEAKSLILLSDEYMWSAYERSQENNSLFVLRETNQTLPEALWKKGQPNNKAQGCVVFDNTGYDDEYCNAPYPFACQMDQRQHHRLRGLCSETFLDKIYFPYTLLGRFVWVGSSVYGNTFIQFNQSSYRWEARIASTDVWAYAEASYESLLLGTHSWTIFNDRRCAVGSFYEKNLSLTFCSDDFFNCDDGGCLPLDYWCDMNFEPDSDKMTTDSMSCNDGSDEQLCHTVAIIPSYQSRVAPSREPPTDINVYLSIIQILDISAKDGKIRLKFNMSQEWLDPRLNFHGIWEDGPYNVLCPEEFDFVWIPEFNYSNIQQKDLEVHQTPSIYVYNMNMSNWNWSVPGLTSLYNYQVFAGRDIKFHWTYKLR